jgi:plastocyanin
MRRPPRIALIALLPLLSAAAAPPPSVWAHAQPMTVVMVDNEFEPDHLVFHAGQAYALTLVNHGKDMHEFTAPAFLKSAAVRDPRVLSNGGGDIVVQPGRTVTVTLLPRTKGEFDLTCADHDWDGMVGHISVR